jgi:hypothetical protein
MIFMIEGEIDGRGGGANRVGNSFDFNSHKEAQEEMFLFCASCASLWLFH